MSDAVALWLGERLLIGSIQGAVVIALVWLVCRIAPRMPAAAQAALWWLAALKLVLVLTPLPALPVPLLPATVSAEAISRGAAEVVSRGTAEAVPYGSSQVSDFYGNSPITGVTSQDGRQPIRTTSWPQFLLLLWLAIVLVQAGRLFHGHRALRHIVNRSVIWPYDETRELAARVGLTRAPQVRLSEEIDTPQVCGLREPVVLVPAGTMATFTAEERAMVLCHELMHVRRRDLALGWVPACAERLFFFHPLARLAARRYVDARETACDAAAVRALRVPVADYARLLVRLGIGTARPALAAGGSPFSTSSLKRRLTMLERHDSPGVSRGWRVALALAAAAMIPMQLVARTPADRQPVISTSTRTIEMQKTLQLNPQTAQSADEKRKAEQAAGARAARMKAAQTSLEQTRRLRERAQQLQQKREEDTHTIEQRLAEQHKHMAERMAEQMALARENARRHEADYSERQLRTRIALLEQMRHHTLSQQALSSQHHETLARQHRELAEHYERLAAEQREAAEAIERLQREAVPAK